MRERAILYKAQEYCISPSAHTQTRTSNTWADRLSLWSKWIHRNNGGNPSYIIQYKLHYIEIAFYIWLKGYTNFSLAPKTQKGSQRRSQPMQLHKTLNTCAWFECTQWVSNLWGCDMLNFTIVISHFCCQISKESAHYMVYIHTHAQGCT